MPPTDSQNSNSKMINQILAREESQTFEVKRLQGGHNRRLETTVAFANSGGGWIVLGLADPDSASGTERLFGIQENPILLDEYKRLLRTKITPPLMLPHTPEPVFYEIPCKLRNGIDGSVVLVRVFQSDVVHSIVEGGTYLRYSKSNRQLTAAEITELSVRRGTANATNTLVDVPYELLETAVWRDYAGARKLTRPAEEALRHIGLARKDEHDKWLPTRLSVLLFAEHPGALLDSKSAIRIFHYKGEAIEHSASTNLMRPPKTVDGPLLVQIRDGSRLVLEELTTGVQVGPLGFEIAQKYPVRAIKEAITNAVIHRDYRLSTDIHIRIFSNRIEVESPGILPKRVTLSTLGKSGSQPRNQSLADHLREFPEPPNLDAGEGIPMMFEMMRKAELYPPIYRVIDDPGGKEAVILTLVNQARPTIWDQVSDFLEHQPSIGNQEVRKVLGTDDPVRTSKLLRHWLDTGLLVLVDPAAPKNKRRYRKPGSEMEVEFISLFKGNDLAGDSESIE